MKTKNILCSILLLASLVSCVAPVGDSGSIAQRRLQPGQMVSSADESQIGRQQRVEQSEAAHQGYMQQEGINRYRRPIQGVRGGLNDAVGIVHTLQGLRGLCQ